MSDNSIGNQHPIHWSKDFAEHLRNVHFTLIAASLGLILVVLSAKPYDATIALGEIQKIQQLKREWSEDWLRQWGTNEFNDDYLDIENLYEGGINTNIGDVIADDVPDLSKVGTVDNDPDSVNWTKELVVLPHAVYSIHHGFTKAGRSSSNTIGYIEHHWYQSANVPSECTPDKFPGTLAEFRKWWDFLRFKPYQVIIPRTIALKRTAELRRESYEENIDLAEDKASTPELARHVVHLSLTVFEERPVYWGRQGLDVFLVPVQRFTVVTLTQKSLSERIGVTEGSFKDSFRDLRLAVGKLEVLDLSDIQKLISDDAAKGSQVFEAFGIKFPAGQVTLWGVIILPSIQLYFLVYLSRMSRKLSCDDAAWDVAWLGMDTSKSARTIFFVTAVICPLCALISLVAIAVWSDRTSLWTLGKIVEHIVLITIIAVSFVMAGQTWRERPIQEGPSSPVARGSRVNFE